MSDEPLEPGDDLDDGADDAAEPLANDASSPRGIESKRKRVAREQREAIEFWRGVFASPVGRREIWKILTGAHTFEERFACGPNGFPQPEATWFHAGEQALGQRLYRTFARDHRAEVLLMHDENDAAFVKAKM